MNVARRASIMAIGAAIGGCVLLVDPIETNDHCGIQGAGDCADCIRKSCEARIDACCASTDCTGTTILGDMDACGRGDVNACAASLAGGRLTQAEEAVRTCASSNCRSACTVGATGTGSGTRPKWTCATPREDVNECASCVYAQCGTKLDACCADSTCNDDQTILYDVASCVAGDARGCAFIREDERSTAGQAGVVRACIVDKCAAKCLGDGLTHTKCTLFNGGKYCACSNSEVAGDQPCNSSSSNGACLIGKDGCTCGDYTCGTTTSGCSCDLYGNGEEALCRAPLGSSGSEGVCCVRLTDLSVTCECRSGPSCIDALDEYTVTSCDRADVVALLQPVGRVVSPAKGCAR